MTTNFASDTLIDLEKARSTSVALENELSRLRAGVEQVVHSIESDSCECDLRFEGEENFDIICVRCHRIALLTPPCATEVDALGQRAPFDASVLVPDCSLDQEIARRSHDRTP